MSQFAYSPSPKPKTKQDDLIYRNGRAFKELECTECKSKFERRTDYKGVGTKLCLKCSHVKNGKDRLGKILANRRGHNLICKVCNKSFYVTPNRTKTKYCSRKCVGIFQQSQPLPKGFITGANNAGSKNGRYKDGKRIGTNTSKKVIRSSVIERDGYWCLYCGKPGPGLHLHRVIYGSETGKYEVNNCVQLCNIHHELIHSNKRHWQPILIKYLSGEDVREWFESYRLQHLLEVAK